MGNPTYNNELSQNRANSVAKYLEDKGIDSSRITKKGFGDQKPVASNDTEEGKAKNRRTEIEIVEKH